MTWRLIPIVFFLLSECRSMGDRELVALSPSAVESSLCLPVRGHRVCTLSVEGSSVHNLFCKVKNLLIKGGFSIGEEDEQCGFISATRRREDGYLVQFSGRISQEGVCVQCFGAEKDKGNVRCVSNEYACAESFVDCLRLELSSCRSDNDATESSIQGS